jgi:molybdopterin converting factor small subunit
MSDDAMRVIVNTFGTEIRLREEISLKPASPSLRDVLSALREQYQAPLQRFLTDDLSPVEGAAILVNGRNMWSLDRFATTIRDGDELTFTVQVAGG